MPQPGTPDDAPDHYRALGVAPDATTQEITRAYRPLARVEHRHARHPSPVDRPMKRRPDSQSGRCFTLPS